MMPHSDTAPSIGVRPLHIEDTVALNKNCWPFLRPAQARARVARILAHAARGMTWPYVGLMNRMVVGFGQLARWRDGVEIADLVVGEQWQSRGVGTALIERLLDEARASGFSRVEVGVAESNFRAAALYRRLGFGNPVGRRLLDLGNGPEPVLYFWRRLS